MCTYFKTDHRIHPYREDDSKATTSRSRTGTSPCTQQNLYNVVQNTTNSQIFVKTGGIAMQSSLQNT